MPELDSTEQAVELASEGTHQEHVARFGWLALLGAGASLISCYIVKLSGALAPLLDTAIITLNPHVQAVFMWGFAMIALVGLALDRRHHGHNLPVAVGGVAFIMIVGTLYTHYDTRVETLGYAVLIIAAFLNQNAILVRLNQTVQAQAGELSEMNAALEQRVEHQIDEIERLARLKRFLAPEIADLITSEDKEALLNSHRGFIACLFCDIRNFTALSEGIEPEEVMSVLQTYHRELGRLISKYGGTIGYRSGDGIMVIINDPISVENPAREAVALAKDMINAFDEARAGWEKLGYNIGFGIGLASGYATLGLVGDEGRLDYTAIGNVVNLAARLCDQAGDGEILINRRIFVDIDGEENVEPRGMLKLKGFEKPIDVFRLTSGSRANIIKGEFADRKKSS
jgi:class 3 adenylate cyclase